LSRPPAVTEQRLEQLCEALRGKRRLLILTHDNPDPDAIAAGWGLMRVVRRVHPMKVDLAYGGIIGRGENRTLREVLRIPLRPFEELSVPATLPEQRAVALVDCQPRTGNNSLPPGIRPTIVIDHHPLRRQTREVPFYDVRQEYGSTTAMIFEYLTASEVRIDRRLATALFYAIKAETQNLGREASRADARTFLHLFPLVDNLAISSIENPRVPLSYFAMLNRAIAGTTLYGPLAVTLLGPVSTPDALAEFADLMIRVEGIRWAVTIGVYRDDILLSVRSTLRNANAGRAIQRIVGREGKAGGHGQMAGGKIAGGAADPSSLAESEALLAERAIAICKGERPGARLLDRAGMKDLIGPGGC